MIKFKIEGKEYSIPTKWEEVTVEQYLKLLTCDKEDIVMFLSIVTGVDYDTMYRTRQTDVDEILLPLISFFHTPIDLSKQKMSGKILLQGKQHDIPKDLGFHSLGQKIEASNVMLAEFKKSGELTGCMVEVVAMYLQPIVTGKEYSSESAKELEAELLKCSIIDVYPVAAFFLKKLIASISVRKKLSVRDTLKSKFKQVFQGSKSTKNSIQLTP